MSKDTDFFRDTSIRYLGYANEVGEAFRPFVSRDVVRHSYTVAMAYVLADTAHKSIRSIRRDGKFSSLLIETGDALIWQTLASVVIPGIAINRICFYSGVALAKYAPKVPLQTRKWMTVGIGLASIPIIVRPIDAGVTVFMKCTWRLIFGSHGS